MNKTFTIRTDATGRFFAVVEQHVRTAAGVQPVMLAARWFNTRRGAERWLDQQRGA